MDSQFRSHRLFVSGGSRLSPEAALFYRQLGIRLAGQDRLVVVTGGLLERDDGAGRKAADWAIVEGIQEGLRQRKLAAEERIETVLPDGTKDPEKLRRFREGRVLTLPHWNVPFDLGGESIIKYGENMEDLRRRLEDVIATIVLQATPRNDPSLAPSNSPNAGG
jgi:hypothetical protein